MVRDIPKLGYKGVDTCELSFDDYRVSGGNLVGGEEGPGFYQIMSGLELDASTSPPVVSPRPAR